MKTSKSIIAIIALAIVATTMVIASCKKEKQEQKSNNVEQSVQSSDNMDEYLMSFKRRLLSAQKGDETISLEQAQRDLGNLLNFDFGDVYHVTNAFHSDTLHLELALSQGQVELSQLAKTYILAYEQVEEAFDLVELPNKTVYTVYCVFDPQSKNDELIDVELILTTRGFNETNNQRDLPNLYDCWSVFHGQGNCDGLYVGYDHVSVLQSVYLLNMPQYGCPDGTAYFTDISITEIYANNYPETGSQTYNQGYRLWVGNQWEYYNGYVDVDEMVYYYNNLCDIIDDEIDALNDDDFKVSAISCAIHQSPSLPNFYYFTFKLEYGKINCNHNNGE